MAAPVFNLGNMQGSTDWTVDPKTQTVAGQLESVIKSDSPLMQQARARALDSACFVAAAGQAYPGPELAARAPTGVGGSLVASPVAEVLASGGPDPELMVCDLDVDTVAAVRDTIGVLRNRIGLRSDS